MHCCQDAFSASRHTPMCTLPDLLLHCLATELPDACSASPCPALGSLSRRCRTLSIGGRSGMPGRRHYLRRCQSGQTCTPPCPCWRHRCAAGVDVNRLARLSAHIMSCTFEENIRPHRKRLAQCLGKAVYCLLLRTPVPPLLPFSRPSRADGARLPAAAGRPQKQTLLLQ